MTDELKQWEYDRGYEKGKADVLDKIRAEIDEQTEIHSDGEFYIKNIDVKRIIDKYRVEQETETWNGIHAHITAPKGTFERIFNDADDDNDI